MGCGASAVVTQSPATSKCGSRTSGAVATLVEGSRKCGTDSSSDLQTGSDVATDSKISLDMARSTPTFGVSPSPESATRLLSEATLMYESGRVAEAAPLFQASLEEQEALCGPDHPDLAATLNNLALARYSQGDISGAIPLYERSLKLLESNNQSDPSLANTYDNYGALLFQQGKLNEAEAMYRRGLSVRSTLLGPCHMDVSVSLANIAGVRAELGDLRGAEGLLRGALAVASASQGPHCPAVAELMDQLAMICARMGSLQDASDLFKQVLTAQTSALGAHHSSTIATFSSLYLLLSTLNQWGELHRLAVARLAVLETEGQRLNEAVSAAGSVNGWGGDDAGRLARQHAVMDAMAVIGQCLMHMGQLTESAAALQRCLDMHRKELGADHPDTLNLMEQLAEVQLKICHTDAKQNNSGQPSFESCSTVSHTGPMRSPRLLPVGAGGPTSTSTRPPQTRFRSSSTNEVAADQPRGSSSHNICLDMNLTVSEVTDSTGGASHDFHPALDPSLAFHHAQSAPCIPAVPSTLSSAASGRFLSVASGRFRPTSSPHIARPSGGTSSAQTATTTTTEAVPWSFLPPPQASNARLHPSHVSWTGTTANDAANPLPNEASVDLHKKLEAVQSWKRQNSFAHGAPDLDPTLISKSARYDLDQLLGIMRGSFDEEGPARRPSGTVAFAVGGA